MADTLRTMREAAKAAGYDTQSPAVQVALIEAYSRGFNRTFVALGDSFIQELRDWRRSRSEW